MCVCVCVATPQGPVLNNVKAASKARFPSPELLSFFLSATQFGKKFYSLFCLHSLRSTTVGGTNSDVAGCGWRGGTVESYKSHLGGRFVYYCS